MRRLSWVLFSALFALVAGCSSSKPVPPPAPAAANKSASEISGSPQVDAILQKSCYTCHAFGVTAPWYAAVSPTYLAAGSARDALNFSAWSTYAPEKRVAEMKSIAKSVGAGSMPPGDYTALDHSARLSAEEKQELLSWASQSGKTTH